MRYTGTWLTKTATRMIGAGQILNVTITLVLIYAGLYGTGAAISVSVMSTVYFFLQEYVMWGYAYCYWVTSQNVKVIYSNMSVMYDDKLTPA